MEIEEFPVTKMKDENMPETKNLLSSREVEEMSYEEAYTELERIVRELENEQASLEGTLELFERGQMLVQRCSTLLEQAELRLRVLSSASTDAKEEETDIEG